MNAMLHHSSDDVAKSWNNNFGSWLLLREMKTHIIIATEETEDRQSNERLSSFNFLKLNSLGWFLLPWFDNNFCFIYYRKLPDMPSTSADAKKLRHAYQVSGLFCCYRIVMVNQSISWFYLEDILILPTVSDIMNDVSKIWLSML